MYGLNVQLLGIHSCRVYGKRAQAGLIRDPGSLIREPGYEARLDPN